MAEIRAEYRRTWQVKPYETETITLSITDTMWMPETSKKTSAEDLVDRSDGLRAAVALYYKQLAEIGDKLLEERLAVKKVPF